MARKKRTPADDDSLFDAPANGDGVTPNGESAIALHEAAQARYLNYALSVITARALPDVRDGLKPVQRRILYTMWQQRLRADAKHRKCAKVCGDVMGQLHPHGDQAIYDALVRMAQWWVMRHRLVDGSGNFGSMDGDPAAAMRYTECRLTPIATPMLEDLGSRTVAYRPSYDGTSSEPVVLPSKVPNLLLNGASGIAVGMATNIPPHNLAELCKACLKIIDNPEVKDYQLVANDAVQGPDFPTGGEVLNSRDELREIYKTGHGTIRLRGKWELGPTTRSSQTVHITAIPYGVNKATLVEKIAEVVLGRRMPHLVDVADVSAEDVRIDLELKKDADADKVMAYLLKHTPLQTTFAVNLTCLVPTENPLVAAPERVGLKQALWHFLHFRLDVVTKRLEHELDTLNKRIHILNGLAIVFDALDEIIAIIRKSDGKADAAAKIMKRFPVDPDPAKSGGGLDAEQTDAILELKLYRLARLEINLILDELKDKKKRAREIIKLLNEKSAKGRWQIIADELNALIAEHGKDKPAKRQTTFADATDVPEFSEEDFIVAEDTAVLITADGWVKRQREIDPQKTRLREGDSPLACVVASTTATIAFFSSAGACYTARAIDLPATTGYGEPIQKLFKLKDGERIVAALSLDPRVTGSIDEDPTGDYYPLTHALAATSDGYALRFGLAPFRDPSTRTGRRFARPAAGAEVVGVAAIHGSETLLAATRKCRAMVCPADDVNYLSGPGKGVLLIKLGGDDKLLGFKASTGERDLLTVVTNRGAEKTVSTAKYRTTARGGRGTEVQKTGTLAAVVPDPLIAPMIPETAD
ncbi:MAG: DNA topoisomerase (ATP-hydrolyzing) [Planctomycetota bacterium]